ncbi:MAG: MSMEG_1061 family FMN-dependent PPOX-type flavoprotein [Pseudomonadota bacterium]
MQIISDVRRLEDLYGPPVPLALAKVAAELTPWYREWIAQSRFMLLSTVGPDGTDVSPRGDDAAVVRIVDSKTLMLPDWHGNNRLDSLRNIVADGRVSLLFMVPGCNDVVRVNGHAVLTADDDLTATFERKGRIPKTVIVITVKEVYFQCPKALALARLWSGEDESARVPSVTDFVRELEAC